MEPFGISGQSKGSSDKIPLDCFLRGHPLILYIEEPSLLWMMLFLFGVSCHFITRELHIVNCRWKSHRPATNISVKSKTWPAQISEPWAKGGKWRAGRFVHVGSLSASKEMESLWKGGCVKLKCHPGPPQEAQPPRSNLKRILMTRGNAFNFILRGKIRTEIAYNMISVM